MYNTRKHFGLALLAGLFAVVAVASSPAAELKGCSNATAAGDWAFTTSGTVTGVGQVAAVGVYSADLDGTLSGKQIRSLGGVAGDETFVGTFSVNPDCLGSATIRVYESGVLVRTTTLGLAYDRSGREQRIIFTSLVLPNNVSLPAVITGEAHRIHGAQ